MSQTQKPSGLLLQVKVGFEDAARQPFAEAVLDRYIEHGQVMAGWLIYLANFEELAAFVREYGPVTLDWFEARADINGEPLLRAVIRRKPEGGADEQPPV